ncbi:MAG: mandelate racemase [Candidatus Latescibacteria bacterium]|nr:mandelate racemase [Candidatus Latescibacterota bacterium]
MAPRLSVKEVNFRMRNVRTRMPFKYGVATLTSVPILHLLVRVELENGALIQGVSADILPPKWFDKDPAKDYAENVADLVYMARAAAKAYTEASQKPGSVFDIWQQGYANTLAAGDERGLNHLTASHGSTLMERALIDALGAGLQAPYFALLKDNALGIDLGQLHGELTGVEPAQVIAPQPLSQVHLRHTVGLADPIGRADIAPDDRLNDGLPQSLEEYAEGGITYFKIKVNGDLEADLERLRAIAALLDKQPDSYHSTLDGNEQYGDMDSFLELVGRVESDDRLQRFWQSVLYIEQPLERSAALDPGLESGIRAAAARRPMLIDESDGDLDTFKAAAALGYKGVSSKNCKGLIKALANQALGQYWQRRGEGDYFLSGEDLMNLPVVPLHQDLTHVAALGIDHVERNGHHYVRGHLASGERAECGQHFAGLYQPLGDSLILNTAGGRLDLTSLQGPGLGGSGPVNGEAMIPLEDWRFDSLA